MNDRKGITNAPGNSMTNLHRLDREGGSTTVHAIRFRISDAYAAIRSWWVLDRSEIVLS